MNARASLNRSSEEALALLAMLIGGRGRPTPPVQISLDTDSADVSVDAADAFAEQVIQAGAAIRLRELLGPPRPGTLYHLRDRNGITVAAMPSTALTAQEAEDLLTFRFAQYLDVGFGDRRIACSQDMRSEPPTVLAPGDVHVVAGVPATGEILCYAVIEYPPPAAPGCRLRSGERELFPVERVHGAGIYNRLPILPDLAISKVRELGRFVRNHRPVANRDLATRAVVEIGVAVFRLMAGPLRLHVDAVVGDLEEHVAKQNLDFFHIPAVVVRGTVPYTSGASYLYPRYQQHTVYPFACLISDIETALPRLAAVEQALAKPGKRGLLALLRLRSQGGAAASMLRRPEEAQLLHKLSLIQPQTSMPQRSLLLERGQWLRQVPAFAGLSVAEAAMLCILMRRVKVPAGHVIACQGDTADALYVIECGQASVELVDQSATSKPIDTVGPGQCCGHAALLPEAEHPVSIIASTDMTMLRLSKADHDTYLDWLPEVGQRLGRDALRQLAELDRHRRRLHHIPTPPSGGCTCGDSCACQGKDDPRVPEACDQPAATPRSR
jgi:hypothetical protein